MTEEKNRFLKWLAKRASFAAVPEIYASLSELDFYCQKRGTLKKPLLETHDTRTLASVRTLIGFDNDFRDTYHEKASAMLSAMQYYLYYVREMGLEEYPPEMEEEESDLEAQAETGEEESAPEAEEEPGTGAEADTAAEAETEAEENAPETEEAPEADTAPEENADTAAEADTKSETADTPRRTRKKSNLKGGRMEERYYDWLAKLNRGGKA